MSVKNYRLKIDLPKESPATIFNGKTEVMQSGSQGYKMKKTLGNKDNNT